MSEPHRQSVPMYHGAEPILTPASDPAMRELLDHLAEELAKEYVRLMKEATPSDTCTKTEPEEEQTS